MVKGRGNKQKRSAGNVPPRAKSSNRMEVLVQQKEMLRKAPAKKLQSAPSIPSPFNPFGGRGEQGGNTYSLEHEAHARKDRHPRNYMDKGL
jgi:hypothetical protein